MGFLDNASITVDAVLTKRGREILKNGGNINVSSFTVSDTGVDYSLWNTAHPSGSAFYGRAIEDLPMLESSVHAEYNNRNRLVTLGQNTIAMPSLQLSNLDVLNGSTKTYDEGDQNNTNVGVKLTGYSSQLKKGYGLIISNPELFSTNATLQQNISGTGKVFVYTEDISNVQEYHFSANTFSLIPIQQKETGRTALITVFDVETAAYYQFNAVNNITTVRTALLSSGGTGAV
tara:strand:- start:939 stop:1634 length:696 start_codon:yes stop_codon:yes gene_type:complete